MWYIHNNGILFSHKKEKILPLVTTWIGPEGIKLSEISQTQKDKNHMTSLTCGIKTPPPSSSQRKTGVCQRQGVSKMGKGGQKIQTSS